MPQLELTNYLNLLLWSLVTFVLLYFTVSTVLCCKISCILSKRKAYINKYNDSISEFINKKNRIEKGIALIQDNLLLDIDKITKLAAQDLESAEKKISKKLHAETIYLRKEYTFLKNNTAARLQQSFNVEKERINKLVKNYLLSKW
jgi:F0F1-type ATP synthase membrane subunit b/b'